MWKPTIHNEDPNGDIFYGYKIRETISMIVF